MAKTIEQIRAELMAAQNPTGGQGGAFKFTTNASFPVLERASRHYKHYPFPSRFRYRSHLLLA